MSSVIIFPRGQLSAKDRRMLLAAGITAVEADDPTKVVQVIPGAAMVGADDMLLSALAGIIAAGNGGMTFVKELNRRLTERTKAAETKP